MGLCGSENNFEAGFGNKDEGMCLRSKATELTYLYSSKDLKKRLPLHLEEPALYQGTHQSLDSER